MATLTRLASTLTAKYFPSKNLMDAFYIDGRLFGKRETRQADITIDKEERGFFFSVFAHPSIPSYEPGMMPPYEPQLRATCNEVKFGRKEIDGMIEGFLATAVDVTGKMKLIDGEERAPYFSGIIVRDSEAFAVTIGSGLAFLYRDDTLFPLTDAGIPMEPIDCNGNRVADFLYYCSSKTANALWSNFFTLSPDDCIILCNKEVYDALGQRELLRILNDAEDQCDAAGVVITQASARMPNVPMQFSISFVESVTSDEKRGLFGFKRKNKEEEDMSNMSITSTFEGGVVGAAAEAAADAGFTSGLMMTEATSDSSVLFGDSNGDVIPSVNQVASSDKGIEVEGAVPVSSGLEFLDNSVSTEPVVELTADEMFKNLFADAAPAAEATAAVTAAEGAATTSEFVASVINPFDVAPEASGEMEVISSTPVEIEESELDKTKASGFDMSFLKSLEESLKKDADIPPVEETPAPIVIEEIPANDAPVVETSVSDSGVTETTVTASSAEAAIKSALEELTKINEEAKKADEEKKAQLEKENETIAEANSSEIVFAETNGFIDMTPDTSANNNVADFGAAFDPYSVGDSKEMENTAPFVFGDDLTTGEKLDVASETASEIPAPEFVLESEKPELKDEDKLAVDFPAAVAEAPIKTEEAKEDEFSLPFANGVSTFEDDPKKTAGSDDIPDMPLYEGNTFDTPVNAVSSEAPIAAVNDNVYTYGQYVENENMAEAEPVAPVQPVAPVNPAPVAPVAPVANVYEDNVMNENEESMPYQSFGNEGQIYTNPETSEGVPSDTYAYQQEEYQGGYEQPADAATASGDDDWINAILGIGGDEPASYDYAAAPTQPAAAPVAPSAPRRQATPTSTQRKPGQQTYVTNNSGNGGRGGSKKTFKLNRNGYMFLAFVILVLVCLIILISAIVKSCSKKEDAVMTSESTDEVTIATTLETTAPTTADPSAPIGMFTFSNDYIGFRTWWDLFNQVYGIDDLSNESDSRISIIVTYNGLDPATYTPNGGDSLLLPPMGVLDGTIPVTFQVGGSSTAEPAATDIQVVDGAAEGEAPAEGETTAAEGAEA